MVVGGRELRVLWLIGRIVTLFVRGGCGWMFNRGAISLIVRLVICLVRLILFMLLRLLLSRRRWIFVVSRVCRSGSLFGILNYLWMYLRVDLGKLILLLLVCVRFRLGGT